MPNLRETILAFDDIDRETVEVPEWGGLKVEIRTPSVARRGQLIAEFMDGDKVNYERMYPALVAATAFDPESGEQLFTNADLTALGEKSSAAMERLGSVATRLSGMEQAAQRLEAGKADSPATRSGDTPSG